MQRANLLRPFEKELCGSVLEVGAGRGAITRDVGEVAESVVAVEGSLRRGKILKQRTRDLDNVNVVVDNFETFYLDQQFDVVVVVGVPEYADIFLQTDNPFVDFLKKLRKLVSEAGILLLATENKVGLKYFAGANEDHLGAPMWGIEGRYQRGGPRTFSRSELRLMMLEAGFPSQFFHSPVPDYRLPVSFITEQGILDDEFDSATLSAEASILDPQLPFDSHFNPSLAWHELGGTALELDMSNSFLVEAHPTLSEESTSLGLLAEHYGSPRKGTFQKTKSFTRNRGAVLVSSKPAFDIPALESQKAISQALTPEKYVFGETLQTTVVKRLLNSQTPAGILAEWVPEWFDIIATYALSVGLDWPHTIEPGAAVDGRLYDAIPRNAIRGTEGVILVDQEWVQSEQISIEMLLFRSTIDVYYSMPAAWQVRWNFLVVWKIASEAANVDASDLQGFFDAETRFQSLVSFPSLPRETSVNRELAAERDALAAERDAAAERLGEIQSTRVWRWTNLLRKAFRMHRER